MSFFFANPWGLLALAAVPAIVGIHCLREKSRRVRASTLFLLDHARPTSTGGVRVERFRNTFPFWMQLLAALSLTWLLADPRWIRIDSRQTVTVVLDSSASMQAFRDRTLDALATRLVAWEATAARIDWHLLETGPRRPPLYAGPSRAALVAAARQRWQPTLGTHPVSEALAAATALAPSSSGSVILVTDRPVPVVETVAVLSVGEPFDNVGISGGDVAVRDGQAIWRAIVTNHGAAAASRELVVRDPDPAGDGPGAPQGAAVVLALAAGQSRTLEGPWPAVPGDRIVIGVTPDRFGADDTLPLVRPTTRDVRIWHNPAAAGAAVIGRMLLAAADTAPATTAAEADLVLDHGDATAAVPQVLVAVPRADAGNAAAERADGAAAGARPAAYDPAAVAAEDHPLTRDLSWGGLLSAAAGDLAMAAGDEPLVWKGNRPLVFLRTQQPSAPGQAADRRIETLVLNFDPDASTLAQSPAFVVMLGRFVDRVRREILRPWADNFQTDQRIELPGGRRARAPQTPGFFTLPLAAVDAAGPRPMLSGAAGFADLRESDFRPAGPVDTLEGLRRERALAQSVEDPWAPLWITVAATAVLLSWGFRNAADGGRVRQQNDTRG